jgi:hypothetical protein
MKTINERFAFVNNNICYTPNGTKFSSTDNPCANCGIGIPYYHDVKNKQIYFRHYIDRSGNYKKTYIFHYKGMAINDIYNALNHVTKIDQRNKYIERLKKVLNKLKPKSAVYFYDGNHKKKLQKAYISSGYNFGDKTLSVYYNENNNYKLTISVKQIVYVD